MPYKTREFTCRCGARFTKRAPASSQPTCINCSVDRYGTWAEQMHRREGPAYADWLAALHRLTGCPLAGVGTDTPLPHSSDISSPGIPT